MATMGEDLAEHRVLAERTHLDVDDLTAVREVLLDALAATRDADVDRVAAKLGALLSVLPRQHVLVVGAEAGLAVGEARRDHRDAMVEASHAVSAAREQQQAEARRRRHCPVRPISPAIPYPPVRRGAA